MFWVFVAMIIVIPTATALAIGFLSFRGQRRPPALPYRCQRCGVAFTRAAHRGFPTACPRCHARNWNERA